jgi:acetylornithine deacetylase/succinyl-diaminopimelate desuccinylase family protein
MTTVENDFPPVSPVAPDPQLAAFLAELVRIPSVNPPGDEIAVAQVVARRLEAAGLDVEIIESAPRRANVIGRLRGTGGGPTLILNGHMDVQPAAGGWTRDPFGAEIEDGRLFGRGSMDMKAGVTAMVFAAERLAASGRPLRGDLVITAVADEVGGGHKGTGFLLKKGLVSGDMAVVCEPTGDQVYVAHRGTAWIEIEVTGKSAHSGRPWMGVNAIQKMSRIMQAIERDLVPRLAQKTHPRLPSPSINFGEIEGGTKFNLVADRAVLKLDRRMLPGETAAACLAEIRAICEAVIAADTETFAVDVREVMSVSGAEISPDAPIVHACQRAFFQVTGEQAPTGATSGFEDAHFFQAAGIDVAMFGPYRTDPPEAQGPWYTNSGTSEESVLLADVEKATAVYIQLALNTLS